MSSRLINAAAHGLTMSTVHPYFNDVNPIKKQSLSSEDRRAIFQADQAYVNRVQKRQAWIKSKGGRILPDLSKQ